MLRIDSLFAQDIAFKKLDTPAHEKRQTVKHRRKHDKADSSELRGDSQYKKALTMGMKKVKGDRNS